MSKLDLYDAKTILGSSPYEVAAAIRESFGPKGPMPPRKWWAEVGQWLAFEELKVRASGAPSLKESPLPMPRSARERLSENHVAAMLFGFLAICGFVRWPGAISFALLIAVTFSIPFGAHRWFREDTDAPLLMWWDMLRLFWPLTIVFAVVEEVAYRQWEHDERRWITHEDFRKRVVVVYKRALDSYRWCLRSVFGARCNELDHLKRAVNTGPCENGGLFRLAPGLKFAFKFYKEWLDGYERHLNAILESAQSQESLLAAHTYEAIRLYEEGDESGAQVFAERMKDASCKLERLFEGLKACESAYRLSNPPPSLKLDVQVELADTGKDRRTKS